MVSTKAKACPKCGAPRKRFRFIKWTLAIFAGLLLLGAFAEHQQQGGKQVALSAGEGVALDFSIVQARPFLVMDFTVQNNNPHPIKDVRIVCEHRAKSGTVIESNKRVIYDIVPAQAGKFFPNFEMGVLLQRQAHTTSCRVADAVKA